MIKVDRIYVPVNMVLALFHKHLQKNRNIFERGIGQIRFFLIVLPIGIAYWPLLFRCGITAPCYSGVEYSTVFLLHSVLPTQCVGAASPHTPTSQGWLGLFGLGRNETVAE